MGNEVKILSMNVRGLFSNKRKRIDVFNWAKSKDASVICFQETHSTQEVVKSWETEWGYSAYFSHCSSKSAGVCILFKENLDFEVHDTVIDSNGRYIVLDVTLQEQRVTLVCLYGHNTDEPHLFQEITQKVLLFKNSSMILCGDWNLVQDKSLDTYNIIHDRNPKAREKVTEMIENFNLVDPWRICNNIDRKYTWHQHNPVKQSRIDYFLVSEDLYSVMKSTKIIPGYKTDHSAITFVFSAASTIRGKGYWKFNSQLLRDLEYIQLVKNCVKETIEEYRVSEDPVDFLNIQLSCNDQIFWEILKVKIRSISISYSTHKAREGRKFVKNLENDIQKLENNFDTDPSDENRELLLEKKSELEKHREGIVEGIMLRSRANWHENGEKCTKFFCSLEKKNYMYVNKTVTELIGDDGKHISNQSDILNMQEKFYKKLYSSKVQNSGNIKNNPFFKHNVKLSDELRMSCEGKLTYEECGAALKLMQNGKSPGSDGYTSDFYKFFWKDVGPFIFRSLNFGYESGKFSQFQSQGVITCIPKENKDRRYMANWRPITLLNTDFKIASAAIANRIKNVLPEIISNTQKGFMKDRFIGENIRLLYDLMHYLEENHLEGLLLLIDFEKAFDSIEWSFLLNSLESFNFGPSICKWFSTFYNNAKSSVINNGFMSDFFCLQRGCRQGDPLSPYLFIIGVELLALKIKSNINIKGINIKNTESVISQYADDTFLTLDGSEKSLRETLECFENFHQVSGLKMNSSKTRAVWIGSKRYSDAILCPDNNLNWSHSNFRLLGIEFSLDLSTMIDLNFKKKIKEITGVLKSWQHRKLSLLGKITVIKTLALSKLVHLFTSLPNLPPFMLEKLNKMFFSFIWDGKPEKIKRNTLIADYLEGGLNVTHLESLTLYLKVNWAKKFLLDQTGI